MRRRWLIIPIGILVVLAVFAVARTSGQVRHADGGGPLASKNIPDDWESFYAARVEGITSWTYGVPLCLAQGTTPAVITSVAPAATIGSGFTSLGAKASGEPASHAGRANALTQPLREACVSRVCGNRPIAHGT